MAILSPGHSWVEQISHFCRRCSAVPLRLVLAVVGLHPASAHAADVTFTDSLVTWQAQAPGFQNVTSNYGTTFTDLSIGSVAYPSGSVRGIGHGWATWCCGYTGNVVFFAGASRVTINLSGLSAFGFQVEPDSFKVQSMTVTLSNGQSKTENVNGRSSAQFFGFVGRGITSITITDNADADFAIGNFYFVASPAFAITSPANRSNFPQTSVNPPSTASIRYSANVPNPASPTNWTLTLNYQTSGVRGPFQDKRTYQAITFMNSYIGTGGQLLISATQGAASAAVQATITGKTVVPSDITTQLVKLYSKFSPRTANLMTGIANQESSYKQFTSRILYGRPDLWPTESFDGGSHIGLMQMPVKMDMAWNWLANTNAGVNLFVTGKLPAAKNIMNQIIGNHRGLRGLSGLELENMALLLYGPGAVVCADPPTCRRTRPANLSEQYYIPYCPSGASNCPGQWQWKVNTFGNSMGVAYARKVRARCVPDGSCPRTD